MGIRQDWTFSLASVNRQLEYVPPDDPYHAELLESRAALEKKLADLTPEAEAKLDAESEREEEEHYRQEEEAWAGADEEEEDDDEEDEGEPA